jgi:hypothetical protein
MRPRFPTLFGASCLAGRALGRSHLHQYLRRHLADLLRLFLVVSVQFVVGSTGLNSAKGLQRLDMTEQTPALADQRDFPGVRFLRWLLRGQQFEHSIGNGATPTL